jgi:hypothetical protein
MAALKLFPQLEQFRSLSQTGRGLEAQQCCHAQVFRYGGEDLMLTGFPKTVDRPRGAKASTVTKF